MFEHFFTKMGLYDKKVNPRKIYVSVGCYYDEKWDCIVHDSGPFSNHTCPHKVGNDGKLMEEVKRKYPNLSQEIAKYHQ